MSDSHVSPQDEEIGRLLNSWLDLKKKGDRCSQSEFLEQHPDYADVLRAHFAILDHMPHEVELAITEPRPPIGPAAARTTPMKQQATTELRIPGFDVQSEIGQGGMGIVYRAQERATGLLVAIKLPRDSFLANTAARQCIVREAEAWTRIVHPHVVRAFDVRDDKTTNYRPAIFMHYCDGGSLAQSIEGRGPRFVPQDLDYLIQVCWGMEFAHNQGLIHCDLKPGNVLLTSSGTALVTDFGLARSLEAFSDESGLSKPAAGQDRSPPSRICGTPAYMAPEQWQPSAALTRQVDVYAFGIMMYEVFCGLRPFHCPSIGGWRRVHDAADPFNPRDVNDDIPEPLADVMRSCLERDPIHRPAGFGELADRLLMVFETLGDEAHASRRAKPTASDISRGDIEARAWALVRLGNGCRLRGDAADAGRQYQEALASFEGIGQRRGMGVCYTNLGVIASRRGDSEQAMDLFNLDLGICSELDDQPGLAKCLGNMGIVAAGLGQFEKAMGLYRRSLAIKETVGDQEGMGATYINMGTVSLRRGHFEEARKLFRQSLALKEQLFDKKGISTCYINLGSAAQALGEYDEAVGCYTRALALKQELGDKPGIASCWLNLGELHRLRGAYKDAHGLCNKALALYLEIGDRRGIGMCHSALGTIELVQGRLVEARDCYKQSLSIAEELGSKSEIGRAYNNLGIIAARGGERDQAAHYFQLHLGLCSEMEDEAGMATSYDNLGILASQTGRVEEALQFFQKSVALKQKSGDRAGQSACYANMATLAARRNELAPALNLYRKSLALKEQLDDRSGKAMCLANMGRIAMLESRLDDAESLLCRSLSIREQLGDAAGVANCYLTLADIAGAKQDETRHSDYSTKAKRLLAKSEHAEDKLA